MFSNLIILSNNLKKKRKKRRKAAAWKSGEIEGKQKAKEYEKKSFTTGNLVG